MLMVMMAAAAVAGMPPAAAPGCAVLPMGGTASAAAQGGELTIAGPEGARVVRVDGRVIHRLGGDVAAATFRAVCRGARADFAVVGMVVATDACPVRYQVVELRPKRTVRVSPRFGGCADGAAGELVPGGLLVSMPAAPASATTLVYRYADGRITAVAAPLPPVVAAAPPPPAAPQFASWTPRGACAIVQRAGAPAAAPSDGLLAAFSRDWPRDWRSSRRLNARPLAAPALRIMVADLACLASLPGGDRVVAQTARPLFASKRHGTTAFEQLDEVARGAATDPAVRAAARLFHAQMRFEVDEPRLR